MKIHNSTVYIILCLILLGCNGKKASPADEANDPAVSSLNDQSNDKETLKYILFFGNSLTAGLGVENADAFPAVIQRRLDSLGLNYKVINAGLSGETTSGGKNRIDWVLRQRADVFVLELGANDGLRGIETELTRSNLQEIIDVVKAKNAHTKIVLAGMQVPPNMGEDYSSKFRSIFQDLAQQNNVYLIPFLLERVGGEPELNQRDGIHPNEEGHKIVADNVWAVLDQVISSP